MFRRMLRRWRERRRRLRGEPSDVLERVLAALL
jgi:hypothetical protein